MTITDIRNKKGREKITMLTAYDYPFARILDQSGVDMILVGDSLANVVLGLDSTKQVGIEEMIYHSKAVRRAVQNAVMVGDMPYSSYQVDPSQAVKNAKRFMGEGGCEAVKIEWFDQCLKVVKDVLAAGIPVMGHIGLTPQTAEQLGGFKVQGKTEESVKKLIDQARQLERLGCFSLVIECVPKDVGRILTETVAIPAIGIGAGVHCDGQVLVIHDLLGLIDKKNPKFVKRYTDLGSALSIAVETFIKEVRSSSYPDDSTSY